MFQTFRGYINRQSVILALAYGLLLWLVSRYGTPRIIGAVILATLVLGGFWLWMKSLLSTCACGKVTVFAGRCPCGGPVQQKKPQFLPGEGWENRPREN